MSLNSVRKEVYKFFDEKLKPIIMEDAPDALDRCEAVADKFSGMRWIVKRYEHTTRISAYSQGYGYLFFMIATPDGKPEYEFGSDVEYHGSRNQV